MTWQPLPKILEVSLTTLQNHPQHDLNLGYRQKIWCTFGPRKSSAITNPNLAHKKRTYLAILSAYHVLPIWEQSSPNDNLPNEFLANAKQVLINETVRSGWQNDINEGLAYLDNLFYDVEEQGFIMAGYCAVKALATALWDEQFDKNNIDYTLTDADINPEDLDASFMAMCSVANGAVWNLESDIKKRLEFWTWWLTIAVPKAWTTNKFDDLKKMTCLTE